VYTNLKERTGALLAAAEDGDLASKLVDQFLILLIALNVFAVILQSVSLIGARFGGFFTWFEVVSVAVFSVEYVCRLWTATLSPHYHHPVVGRLKYALTPMALVDLVAIAPFFLSFIGVDLRFLRVLRLFRMFRILKLGRYSSALQAFGRVFSRTRAELALVGFTLLVALVLVSSLMYLVEGEVQPELFSSIPAAMWWSIVTLTTVGYGDAVPVTDLGRILGAFVAIAGIGLYALPTGILGAAFVQEMREERGGNAQVKKQDLD